MLYREGIIVAVHLRYITAVDDPVLTYENIYELYTKMFLETLLSILLKKAERNMNSREVFLCFLGK
jgi:hypothetical protein